MTKRLNGQDLDTPTGSDGEQGDPVADLPAVSTGAELFSRIAGGDSIWALGGEPVLRKLWWLVFVSAWDDIGRYSSATLKAEGSR